MVIEIASLPIENGGSFHSYCVEIPFYGFPMVFLWFSHWNQSRDRETELLELPERLHLRFCMPSGDGKPHHWRREIAYDHHLVGEKCEVQDPKMEVLYHISGYILGDIPSHRPKK